MHCQLLTLVVQQPPGKNGHKLAKTNILLYMIMIPGLLNLADWGVLSPKAEKSSL